MSVHVEWADDNRSIVRYNFKGKWDWNDLYPALDTALEMETSVDHRVDVVLDLRRSKGFPANVISHLQIIIEKQPDNLHLSIFVTEQMFAKMIMRVMKTLSGKIATSYRIAPEMKTAFAQIHADRQSHAEASILP